MNKDRIRKILIIVSAAFVTVFLIAYLFLVFKGKGMIIKQIETATGKPTKIAYFGLTPDFHLQVKGLEISGLANVESIYITPNIFGLITGKLGFNTIKVINPRLILEKNIEASNLEGESALTANVSVSPSTTSSAANDANPPRIAIKHLKVKDGVINIIDHTAGANGIKLIVKDINIDIRNLYIPARTVVTKFEFSGKIPWQEGVEEGRLEFNGWINLGKRDMQATLKVLGIDGIYLYPYYSNWVDLEKARIQSAKLNFTSEIKAVNNEVTAPCHLELADIVRKPLEEGEDNQKAAKITDAVLDIFRALNQGKIVLDFTIHTKMDKPEFGFGAIRMAFEHKLAKAREGTELEAKDMLKLPGNLLEGLVKGATNFSKAVFAGTTSLGKELTNSVAKTFNKPPDFAALANITNTTNTTEITNTTETANVSNVTDSIVPSI
jgi:hypothetical protein